MSESTDGLVSPKDIAELAGVNPPVVSNWRKRSDDFPSPASGSPARPLFRRGDIVEWLRANRPDMTIDESPGLDLWALVNALRSAMDSEETAVSYIMSLAYLRNRAFQDGEAASLWQSLASTHPSDLPKEYAALAEAGTRVLVGIDPESLAQGPHLALPFGPIGALPDDFDTWKDLVETLLERASRSRGRADGIFADYNSKLSRVLGAAAAATRPESIHDPAVGLGSTILNAFGEDLSTRTRVSGYDISPDAVDHARGLARVHGIGVDYRVADVLSHDPDPSLRADVVVLEPPFGQRWDGPRDLSDPRFVFGVPRQSADLAWIQHVVAHLTDSGLGFVVTPVGTLTRGGSEGEIRSRLVNGGAVRAVFALPPQLLRSTSIPLAMWVVTRPRAGQTEVDLLDLSGLDLAETIGALKTWAQGEAIEAEQASVSISDLLAVGADLSPRRWMLGERKTRADLEAQLENALTSAKRAVDLLAQMPIALNSLAVPPDARVVTVGELIDQRAVEFVRRGQSRPAEDQASAIVRAADISDRTLPPSATGEAVADATVPGDVLVAHVGSQLVAVCDRDGGHVLGPGVVALRSSDHDALAPEFLATVVPGSWNLRFVRSQLLGPAEVRNFEVPLPTRDAQTAIGVVEVFVVLSRAMLAAVSSDVEKAREALLEGLRYGTGLGNQSRLGEQAGLLQQIAEAARSVLDGQTVSPERQTSKPSGKHNGDDSTSEKTGSR